MDFVSEAIMRGISRRTFLKGAGSLAAVPLLAGCSGSGGSASASSSARSGAAAGDSASNFNTRLVLLGTMGGVSWWPGSNRASSSTALVVGNTIYLIDLGQGASYRLSEAFSTETLVNPDGTYTGTGSSTFLKDVKALFFTHLHQDHIADYPALLLIGPGAGLGAVTPLKVYGPCNRGQLEIDKTNFSERGGKVVYTDSANPASITPTPGTRQMTEVVWQAFAQTINNITLDAGYPDFRSLVEVMEIGTPLLHQNSVTCPAMAPFEVYRDNLVRVSATLVDHHQVYPSFAFRFDTHDGSVVFSGDTGPNTNGNLQRLADRADFLVHEVIDRAWIDYKFGTPEPGSQMDALKTHMLESHTTIDSVGWVASQCRVKTLVLNHIVPGNTPIPHLLNAKQNFPGKLIIGEDLMQIGVG